MISSERLSEQLCHLRTISDPAAAGSGINRIAFSDADWEARRYITGLMNDAGLGVTIDAFGNVRGHLPGRREDLPAIMFGSHADSVPDGGNYDGIVGILSAIEVVKSMQEDHFQNDHPLDVVLFMCEESSRFSAATLGSRAMRGELSAAELKRRRDAQGKSLYDVLKARGLNPEAIASAKYDRPLKAFFEVHIEQGKVLEHTKTQLGIVTGIAAPTRLRVHLHGKADHSGATPMGMRFDSSCAAAEIILQVEKSASAYQAAPVVGTVGIVRVTPCAMNVIPGETELGIDIRSISAEAKDAVANEICRHIEEICQQRSLTFDIEEISKEKPAVMAPAMLDFLSAICQRQNRSWRFMPSGAGHDAMHWTDYTATGMLFIPCKDGISHNAAEFAEIKDIVAVAEVLEEAVRTAAQASFHFDGSR